MDDDDDGDGTPDIADGDHPDNADKPDVDDDGIVDEYDTDVGNDGTVDPGKSDSDGDGIGLAIEYVIGGDPLVMDSSGPGLPSVVLDPDTKDIFVKFRQRNDLTAGVIQIQGKAAMLDPWATLVEGVDYEVYATEVIDDEIDEITISTNYNVSGFFQLLITP